MRIVVDEHENDFSNVKSTEYIVYKSNRYVTEDSTESMDKMHRTESAELSYHERQYREIEYVETANRSTASRVFRRHRTLRFRQHEPRVMTDETEQVAGENDAEILECNSNATDHNIPVLYSE